MAISTLLSQAAGTVQSAGTGAQSLLKGGDFLNRLTDRGPAFLRPKTVLGIGGFVFDYAGEIAANLDADVTDHYLEDNSTVNDHVGLRPPRLIMKGLVAELVQTPQGGALGAIALLQNKLGQVPGLLGKYTPQATYKLEKALSQAQKAVNQLDANISRVKNLVGLFGRANPGTTKQSQAYTFLEGLMSTRQVMLVETPYRMFDNMVITGLGFVQPEDTRFESEIVVTLKQLRFVKVKVSSVASDSMAPAAAQQRNEQVDNGRTKGGTFLYDLAVKPFLGKK